MNKINIMKFVSLLTHTHYIYTYPKLHIYKWRSNNSNYYQNVKYDEQLYKINKYKKNLSFSVYSLWNEILKLKLQTKKYGNINRNK